MMLKTSETWNNRPVRVLRKRPEQPTAAQELVVERASQAEDAQMPMWGDQIGVDIGHLWSTRSVRCATRGRRRRPSNEDGEIAAWESKDFPGIVGEPTLQHELVSQLTSECQSTSSRHLLENLRGTPDRDESASDVMWKHASVV